MKEVITAQYLKTLLPSQDFLICGSLAISLVGINCPKRKDLDIVLVNPPQSTLDVLKDLQKTYPVKGPKISKDGYPESNTLYRFMYDGIDVDVFISASPIQTHLMTKEGIRITPINYVVNEKLKLNRPKDYIQLKNWADQIMSDSKLKELFTLF